MNVKQLKKLIVETVRREIDNQRDDIVKEVKAELFDILMSGKGESSSVVESKSTIVSEAVPAPPPELDRNSLRELFQNKMNQLTDGDTIMASNKMLADVPNTVGTSNIRIPETNETPRQFGPEHEKVLQAINKDYSAIMKKLENRK